MSLCVHEMTGKIKAELGETIMRKTSLITLAILLGVFALTCSQKPIEPANRTGPEVPIKYTITQADKDLAGSANNFGFKLFKAINEDGYQDSSLFISPLSVSMALGMAYNGAGGETREAIGRTLELPDLPLEEINASYKNLISFLMSLDPDVVFQIANSNWIRKGFPVKQEFLDLNRDYFNAVVRELDFNDPQAADIINAWVEEKTNGKIKDIIQPPIDPLIIMYLINAIYFKGAWTYEFDPENTEDRPFYLANGTTIDCPTMTIKAKFGYYYDDDVMVVDLPYGNDKFSMTIFLPPYQTDINTLIADFTRDNFDSWCANLSRDSINLFMPKFKLERAYGLKNIIKSLGMEVAFYPETADFTNINEIADLYISDVKHKTFVEVNEEGTEAAAVTVVTMSTTSVGPEQEIFVYVDRPFLFVIRDNVSNSILFMGKIMEPEA